MKDSIKYILSICLISLTFSVGAQTPQVDVQGDTKIRGSIDISHMNDATTLLIGRDAGKNFNFTFQRYSTLVGVSAGYSNSDGSRNSLFGYNAGYGNTAGYSNSFFGYEAGVNNTSGTRNTFLGTTADVVSFGDSLDRAIAIGYGAKVDCSHCMPTDRFASLAHHLQSEFPRLA